MACTLFLWLNITDYSLRFYRPNNIPFKGKKCEQNCGETRPFVVQLVIDCLEMQKSRFPSRQSNNRGPYKTRWNSFA